MPASTALEFHFSVDRNGGTKPPLLFHHIAGAPGLSFRQAIAAFFRDRGCGHVEVPGLKAGMKTAGNWPAGFVAMFQRIRQTTGLHAVLSQHTAELADVTDTPILSIVEEPSVFLDSLIGSRASALVTAKAELDLPGLIAAHGIANPQAHSLAHLKIPDQPPRDAPERERWELKANRIAERFVLFRSKEYGAFLHHCHERYGIEVDSVLDKPKRSASSDDPAITALQQSIAELDPVWFDRMLYERAHGLTHEAGRAID